MANGVIENSIPANEFRTRIPDKMVLKNGDADNSVAKHKIFITDGNIDTVNNNKFVPRIVGKNIIDAVNDAGAVAKATHAVNADNATNATEAQHAVSADSADKIQVSIGENSSYYSIYVSNTVPSPSELAGKIVFITEE